MRTRLGAVTLVLLLAAAASAQSPALSEARSAQSNAPRELFERARMLEESNANLREAVALYAKVASETTDRQLAATAHLRVALLNERLGRRDEAVKVYDMLVREYADQRDVADRARGRLAELPAPRATPALTAARLVWAEPGLAIAYGSPSPDGRFIAYVERNGHVAVRNLQTGRSTPLTTAEGVPTEYALSAIYSPDGRYLAVSWWGKAGVPELRIMELGRNGLRPVHADPAAWVQPFGWSPDARDVFVIIERRDGVVQLASVPVAGGTARIIKTFDWQVPAASVSPDGKWIAYSIRRTQGAPGSDLFLLAADGSREVALDRHPSDNQMPAWTPDGAGIVFVSNRGGTLDAWFIRVADGQPRGAAAMVKQNVGRGRTMGFARDGRLFYGVSKQSGDVYVADVDPGASHVEPAASALSERFVGANSLPDWSPDGERLLFVSQRGNSAASRTIVVRSIADGREHELSPRLQYFHRPRWTPDGRTIVAQAQGLSGPPGLFTIDPQTAAVAPLVTTASGTFAAHQAWSRDGKTLFYTVRDEGDSSRIVARDMATGRERELERSATSGGEKTVSPDGKWLAVLTVLPPGRSGIRIYPIAGGPARDVVLFTAPERVGYFGGLSWTPDGRSLLFVKEHGDRGELSKVDVDTGRMSSMGLSAPGLSAVRLHPDGRRIAYAAGNREEEVWVIENFLPPASPRARQSPDHLAGRRSMLSRALAAASSER